MFFTHFRGFALTLALAAIPVCAGTLTITSIEDPNGNTVTTNPFALPDGTSNFDTGSWTSVAATVFGGSDLQLSGNFSCATVCNDYFTVDFTGTGYNPGATAYVSVFTTYALDYGFSLQAIGAGNQTLGQLFENANSSVPIVVSAIQSGVNSTQPQFFTDSSNPVVVNSAGDFSGVLLLDVQGGSFSLPSSQTADLIINDVVPEPGTLAIGAACLLLLVYVKRLRKA
jgi:hypothetical protein